MATILAQFSLQMVNGTVNKNNHGFFGYALIGSAQATIISNGSFETGNLY